MILGEITNATGLDTAERDMLTRLVDVWYKTLQRNQLKTKYYDYKNELKNIGIAIPPDLTSIESVVCWPAKAVDTLAARSRFDGFTFGDSENESEVLLRRILADNNFKPMYTQAVTSELINSCMFITVTQGGAEESPAVINYYSAESAVALWDGRKKRVSCGMAVIDVEKDGKGYIPCWVNLYTDNATIMLKKMQKGLFPRNKWTATKIPHTVGRPLIEPMAYRPSLKRPFGKSRISRAVMSITDNAVREILRTEITAELYTTPQKYLLGASEEDFDKPKWEAYIGSIFTATVNEEGILPSFGQLPQVSMQPHTEYMRDLAAQFAGATAVPISSLGIIHDNPASAEAIYAAKEDLVIEATLLNETNGAALRNIGLIALAVAQGRPLSSLSDVEHSLQPRFRNPAMPSVVSQSDAIVKQAKAIPWIGETEVALEQLGYDEEQRVRMLGDKRRIEARERIEARMAANADKK